MLKLFKNKTKKKEVESEKDNSVLEKKKEERGSKSGTSKLDMTYRHLLSPLVTEKSAYLKEGNKYVFKVSDKASKVEIKKAVQLIYGAKVADVNVINIHPKKRRFGRSLGFKSGYRKAIVSLIKGEKIEEL